MLTFGYSDWDNPVCDKTLTPVKIPTGNNSVKNGKADTPHPAASQIRKTPLYFAICAPKNMTAKKREFVSAQSLKFGSQGFEQGFESGGNGG
jgi:hypothetical protein